MELMLASKYNEKRAEKLLAEHDMLYVQEKYDGARVYVKDGELYTRNHKHIIIPECDFKKRLKDVSFEGIVLDGELLAIDINGNVLPRKDGNGIINSAIKGNVSAEQQFRLMLFDCIHPDGMLGYWSRLNYVLYFATEFGGDNIQYSITKGVDSVEGIQELYKKQLELGHEGIMIKSPMNVYSGRRVPDVMKLKEEKTADLEVIGAELGKGKYTGMLGSLVCTTADKTLLVSVGSGLTDDMRKTIPPVGTIVEVKYNQVIQNEHGDYSLFLPIFVGYRNDKTEANKLEELL